MIEQAQKPDQQQERDTRYSFGCPKCNQTLSGEELTGDSPFICRSCSSELRAWIFPAYGNVPDADPVTPDRALTSESTCFHHEDRRAAASCGTCGRFLCSMCRIEESGDDYCPSCFEDRLAGTEEDPGLPNERYLWDKVVLYLSFFPLFLWPVTLATAPVSLYLGIMKWSAPDSLVRRSRWRMVLGIVFALLQVGGWVLLGYFLVSDFVLPGPEIEPMELQ